MSALSLLMMVIRGSPTASARVASRSFALTPSSMDTASPSIVRTVSSACMNWSMNRCFTDSTAHRRPSRRSVM